MFWKKKSGEGKQQRWERGFSIMLAEELLRTALKNQYGDEVRIFQCGIVATPPTALAQGTADISLPELKIWNHGTWAHDTMKERRVTIIARVGPFGPLYPDHIPEDRRRRLCEVRATCRLFSIETRVTYWQPHYLHFEARDDNGLADHSHSTWYLYEGGRVVGQPSTKNTDNPCQAMCDSQTAFDCQISVG